MYSRPVDNCVACTLRAERPADEPYDCNRGKHRRRTRLGPGPGARERRQPRRHDERRLCCQRNCVAQPAADAQRGECEVTSRWTCVVALVGAVGLLGGCSAMPSYDTVREDTIAAGRDVIATFPASAQVVQQPDLEPYACDSDGYMYTGQWTVTLPTGAEMAPLLAALPDALGDDWVITPGASRAPRDMWTSRTRRERSASPSATIPTRPPSRRSTCSPRRRAAYSATSDARPGQSTSLVTALCM